MVANFSPGVRPGTESKRSDISCCHLKLMGSLSSAPRGVEIDDLHNREEILVSAKDGIVGDADLFQFGKQLRPDVTVSGVVLFFLARL